MFYNPLKEVFVMSKITKIVAIEDRYVDLSKPCAIDEAVLQAEQEVEDDRMKKTVYSNAVIYLPADPNPCAFSPPEGSGGDFTVVCHGNETLVRGPNLSIKERDEGGFTFWPIGSDPVEIPCIPTNFEEWKHINAICVEKCGQGIPEMYFPNMKGNEQLSFDPSRSLNDAFDE
jgi:hypothetical protein